MNQKIIRKYTLEGLDCAGCAGKIENQINNLELVKEATLDFVHKIITIEFLKQDAIEDVLERSKQIVHALEPHVQMVEKGKRIVKKYVLEGLDCAGCSGKIEKQISELDHVLKANLDFVHKIITIEFDRQSSVSEVVAKSRKIVTDLEPHVQMSEVIKGKQSKVEKKEAKTIGGLPHTFVLRLTIGAIIFAIAVIGTFSLPIELALYLSAYVLIGGDVVYKALRNIFRGDVFDENFLMSIATVGAFAIKEFPEAVAVMLFYQIGEVFQAKAVNKSRQSISALLNIRPDYANLKKGSETIKVDPEEVEVGDFILVKAGEKVPLDGTVLEGTSTLDTSALTGESIPRDVTKGDVVLSGFINQSGLLTIEVEKTYEDSTVAKILDLVQNASGRKAETERFITKFARSYTPIVVYSALAIATLPPLLLPDAVFQDWLYRALIFLVVSCPCALVVSIPLGFFGGIGGASKHGILIKGSNYLEALNQVKTVVFDKTGTLTKGTFVVSEVHSMNETITQEELLEYTAYAEYFSNHPIAKSVISAYGKTVDVESVTQHEEIAGKGVKVIYSGKEIVAGNRRLMKDFGLSVDNVKTHGTLIHVGIDGQYVGYIVIADEIKHDAKATLEKLREKGVENIVMLTGDHETTAQKVATELGIEHYYAELLPQDKVEKLEELEHKYSKKGKLIFVGDGVNDAPVLARADIGVAMGALGSDAAIEAADIVLMTDEPSKIVDGISIAQATRKIVWQNIVFAMGVKGIVLIMGAGGIATMWEAVFADVGVALLAVMNASRVLKIKV